MDNNLLFTAAAIIIIWISFVFFLVKVVRKEQERIISKGLTKDKLHKLMKKRII